jgi:hypothetical protein
MDSESKDDQMSGISGRIQDTATTTVRNLRALAGGGSRGRGRAVAAVAAGASIALAVGIGWGLSSGDRTDPADLSALPGGTPGVAGSGQQDPSGTADGADGQPGDSGSAGGTGTAGSGGTGSGDPGGGPPANQPPVVDDPGLSSDGMVLRIAPTVTDPDGDEVSLLFEVGGTEVDPATSCYLDPLCKGDEFPSQTPTKAAVRLDPSQVGHRYEAPVVIIATDSRGATTRESFTHVVAAVSTVTVRDLEFRVRNPADCFQDEPSRALRVTLGLRGPVNHTSTVTRGLTQDRSVVALLSAMTGEVVGQEPAQAVRFTDGSFAGASANFARTHRQSADQGFSAFSGDCQGHFTYSITISTR